MSAEPGRPSGRAVERLATGVGAEVSGLRNQLRRALDEADRLQAAGREDLAVTVLEEQRDVLMAVHRQLEARLAEAVVEREAEGVLAEAACRAPLREVVSSPCEPAEACGPVAPDHVPAPVGDDHMGLRLVAAAAAAVLGVALLLTPEIGPGSLSAAGAAATSSADAPGGAPRAVDGGTTPTVPRPAGVSEGHAGQTVHVRDVWALALPSGGAATPDEGRDADDGADLTDVLRRLSLPTAAAPFGPVTADPTALVVDGDVTDDGGGTAGSATDDGVSTDDGATGDDDDGADGTGQPEDEPRGGASSDDGAGGTDATGPSDGATRAGGDTDDGSDGEGPDDGGSVDLDAGEVTPGPER